MQGRIELLDRQHEVNVFRRDSRQFVEIGGGGLEPAALSPEVSGEHTIRFGDLEARIFLRANAERVHIRAFGRTFDLRIVNPVEQAGRLGKGSGNKAIAPMPGVVVDVHVAPGKPVIKGQVLMTIESMKILTAITAPGNGCVESIAFQRDQSFEKGAVLAVLRPETE